MKTRTTFLLAASLCCSLAIARSDETHPNENLVLEGVPKIPASLTEQVGRYTEFRSAGLPAFARLERRYLTAKDEGHGFGKKNNRDFQFYATGAFGKEFRLK